MQTAQSKSKTQLLLPALLVLACVVLAVKAHAATFALLLSLAFSYLLSPVVSYFEARGFRRNAIAAVIYLLFGAVAVYCIYYLVDMLARETSMLRANLPVYTEKMASLLKAAEDKVVSIMPYLKPYMAGWKAALLPKLTDLAKNLPALAMTMLPALSLLVLVPFISFFFVVEGKQMLNIFLDQLPSKHVEIAQHIISEVDEALGNYMRGISLEASILFVLALVGLVFLNLEYAVWIAAAMGFSSLIPYIGPIVGGILGGVAAYVQFSDFGAVLQVLLFFVCLRVLDDWVLQPMILERAVKVHPVVIVLSLVVGGELFGLWGIIFAMPVTCIVKVFLQVAVELQRTEFGWKPKPEPTRISIPFV